MDSERILGVLGAHGFVYTQDLSRASIIIINTCAFIEAAVKESLANILDVHEENPSALLVVAGCLPLRYQEKLNELLPEVDIFVRPDNIPHLPDLIRGTILAAGESAPILSETVSSPAPSDGDELNIPRTLTTRGYAYLKIAEGCSRRCRYCTIPSIRGAFRSFSPQALENEAVFLSDRGVRELVLVAQDLTAYGTDLPDSGGLVHLLERLQRIQGLEWIRLMYLYPTKIPKDLPHVIRDSDKILPYLDIPLQHVSAKVLRAMGRPGKRDHIQRLVDKLRKEIPGLVIRTTFMVGYPTEGEREFQELRDFVVSNCLEHVGVFVYSSEEGTPANRVKDKIDRKTKYLRAKELQRIHSEQVRRRNLSRLGRIERALIEGVSSETEFLLQGRTWDQAPEVDGVLYITAGNAEMGQVHSVRLTHFHGMDLFGEICS